MGPIAPQAQSVVTPPILKYPRTHHLQGSRSQPGDEDLSSTPFDEIRGRFSLVDGQTFTCNLSLEGPAAQIGVVGRAGLVDRDYDQTAVVSVSVGNALPVVGAALGGPTVAAVVLIFSQIFKKPLSEVGQVYYGISGSWDEPIIESVTAEEFAEQGIRAGCIENVE